MPDATLRAEDKTLPLSTGKLASVEIKTGSRVLMEYILSRPSNGNSGRISIQLPHKDSGSEIPQRRGALLAAPGVVSTGTPSTTLIRNRVQSGMYDGVVDGGEYQPAIFDTITWTFPVPIIGFGMDLIEAATADVLTITGDFDGTGDQVINVLSWLSGDGDGFLGIIGTVPFTSIVFSDADAKDLDYYEEMFNVDNLAFAVAQVPEPATLALLGSGLAGLGLIARRRKQEGSGSRGSD